MNYPPLDNGAKYYKCDFQIHTLRDLNWQGPFHCLNDRKAFAEALIADCRRKNIQAIAITDHHDLCLWRFIHNAADQELDSSGHPFLPNDRVIVFPGIELTLSNPCCQALLILDPDLEDRMISYVLGALRITQSAIDEEKTSQTTALPTDMTIHVIQQALSSIRLNPEETDPAKHRFLSGKFIILPHVNPGGHKTFLREGFHNLFSSMNFVGGYLEGRQYSSLNAGDKRILEGEVAAWGSRSLGIFQTSDCRKVQAVENSGVKIFDFVNLGAWPTWVKWSSPSAEAIRQACLAKNSRITHQEPFLPQSQILGVCISDSCFLGSVELGLNPQFNAFIGGRGTGKSSLLEYIRWALCDEPQETSDAIELPNFNKRRKKLVDETLKSVNGAVSVFYKNNEVVYKVVRDAKEDNIKVFDRNNGCNEMTPDQVRKSFPIVSYAQKQLSSVGTLPDEVNRLIEDPIKTSLLSIQEKLENSIIPALKDQRAREQRLQFLTSEIIEIDTVIKSKKEQIQALQAQLKSLSPEQQQAISSHESFIQEQQFVKQAMETPKSIAELLAALKSQLITHSLPEQPADLLYPEKTTLLWSDSSNYLANAISGIDKLIKDFESNAWLSSESVQAYSELKSIFFNHQAEYDKCILENSKNKVQTDAIQDLNKQISDLSVKRSELDQEKNSIHVTFAANKGKAWLAFRRALWQRSKLLMKQCKLIASQAQMSFRPVFMFCADERVVIRALKKLVEGKNIRGCDEKLKDLANFIVSERLPFIKWQEFVDEFEALINSKESPSLPQTPLFVSAGFTKANLETLRNNVAFADLENIRFINPLDKIRFEFHIGRHPDGSPKFIPFDTASPGQQATCLLKTLLAQSGAPLLIDQPEEDLDNEQIHLLAGDIAVTKHNRQLLFVSHNANIVVNGDAELVVCFGYSKSDDISSGQVKSSGSIDNNEIRAAITTIMEGGKQAFELRLQKYGF